MDAAGFAAVGDELDAFAGQVFSSLRRSDQRATGGLYLRGLMLDGRRKSMQPMAARLGVDHQRLQQFITSSPWDVVPVRRSLARLAIEVIGPQAWVVDDTGQVKEGTESACVARQYSGTLGKIGNCQWLCQLGSAPAGRPDLAPSVVELSDSRGYGRRRAARAWASR